MMTLEYIRRALHDIINENENKRDDTMLSRTLYKIYIHVNVSYNIYVYAYYETLGFASYDVHRTIRSTHNGCTCDPHINSFATYNNIIRKKYEAFVIYVKKCYWIIEKKISIIPFLYFQNPSL